jgi:Spy/CpxP family protein refolding chaperone
MRTLRLFVLGCGLIALGGVSVGQDAKKEKEPSKPTEPMAKVKGQLPTYWKMLGLTDEQKQKVYTIDAKYDAEIEKLTAKIAEMKETKKKEQLDVLTAEQKKRLKDIAEKKLGVDK